MRAEWRAKALSRLASEEFDVLVIGGGVTGCGVALDAASRDLSVALLEKRDFAAGTSSRSSKLIHGGLRYLKNLELGLVREALHERRLLVEELAPHLVRAIPFLLPLTRPMWDRLYLGAGLLLYDTLAGLRPGMPRHRHLSRAACLRAVPSLQDDALAGGLRYFDAQVDDARFSLTLARTAVARGAVCVPAVSAVGFLRDGARVTGVRARDLESGESFEARARVVINATGVWTSEVERLAGVARPLAVRPSKGIHLVVPKSCISSEYALLLPTEKSVLFVLPWGDHWIVGTTDTEWHHGLDDPVATHADVQYLLEHANRVLQDPLSVADISAVYVGLRPLLHRSVADMGSSDTTRVSREHVVRRSMPGLVSVAGGKYTTYRVMARDAVDAASGELPFAVTASRTKDIPLLGAIGLALAKRRLNQHPGARLLQPGQLEHLIRRYGAEAEAVLEVVAEQPSAGASLAGAEGYIDAEVIHATQSELALHVDDVLARRTHIAIETADRGSAAVSHVAALMAPILGWDRPTVNREIADYRACLDAESAAMEMCDDAAAESIRSRVHVRPVGVGCR